MTELGFADLVQHAEQRVGTTLKGKWHIDRLIGVGGMASVYAATHRNNKRVAIKLLHPALSMLRSVRERFQREGYVANSVEHRGAVSVDDDDVAEDGCAFLIMELLEGETLEMRRHRSGGRLAVEEALSALEQVLDTLSAAHAKGIVHRDIKPDNLFLTRSGDAKVLDFGIARLREVAVTSPHTQTSNLLGTPAFMPPEQARGRWEEVDAQSDLWAVGATLFTLLTGEGVHKAATFNELLISAATQPAPPLELLLPSVHPAVAQIVDRALAFEKSERWPDAASMRHALRKAIVLLDEAGAQVEGAPEPAEAPTPPPPKPSTALAAPFVKRELLGFDSDTELGPPRWPAALDSPSNPAQRLSTSPGVVQNVARRAPSQASYIWAACTLLAAGIVFAVVLATRHRTPALAVSTSSLLPAPPTDTGERHNDLSVAPAAPVRVEDLPVAPRVTDSEAQKRRLAEAHEPASTPSTPSSSSSVPLSEPPAPIVPGLVHVKALHLRQMGDGGAELYDAPYGQ